MLIPHLLNYSFSGVDDFIILVVIVVIVTDTDNIFAALWQWKITQPEDCLTDI